MRGTQWVVVGALVFGCTGLERGKTYPPPDPGVEAMLDAEEGRGEGFEERADGSDAAEVWDAGEVGGGGEVADVGDAEEGLEVRDALDAFDTGEVDSGTGPGVLRHYGWFGPGGRLRGTGLWGYGFVGARQGWRVD